MESSHPESLDILVIGAGLSGINTAHAIAEHLPHRSYTILESLPTLGGTWSLFRYPGIRADASMHCLSFRWHPWLHRHTVAKGSEILRYLHEAADAGGITQHIRFKHKVVNLTWRTRERQWTVEVDVEGARKVIKANFVVSCTGYYSYSKALDSPIPGIETFHGEVLHPQFWPEEAEWTDKRVVVVGSGSTATTLVPALAKKAEHVTMLQRSPSHVITIPQESPPLVSRLRRVLPSSVANPSIWWILNLKETRGAQRALARPGPAEKAIKAQMRAQLPKDVDVDVHFSPSYAPYRQRPALVPDGDFFKAFHQGNCEVVTDVIDTVTPEGILLKSGRKLEADMIVTATGLHFEMLGGITPEVDGRRIELGETHMWRGCMVEHLPNLAFIMGYTTQTWTPGAEVIAKLIIRVLKRMERTSAAMVTPEMKRDYNDKGEEVQDSKSPIAVTSNYIVKAAGRMPKVTGKGPWYGREHFWKDLCAYMYGNITDGLVYGS